MSPREASRVRGGTLTGSTTGVAFSDPFTYRKIDADADADGVADFVPEERPDLVLAELERFLTQHALG